MSLESETSPPELLVKMENVSKTFGEKVALQDVTWSLPRGQISGLLGPNEAGKTTLFRPLRAHFRRRVVDG